jgi:hypothetical protein
VEKRCTPSKLLRPARDAAVRDADLASPLYTARRPWTPPYQHAKDRERSSRPSSVRRGPQNTTAAVGRPIQGPSRRRAIHPKDALRATPPRKLIVDSCSPGGSTRASKLRPRDKGVPPWRTHSPGQGRRPTRFLRQRDPRCV